MTKSDQKCFGKKTLQPNPNPEHKKKNKQKTLIELKDKSNILSYLITMHIP